MLERQQQLAKDALIYYKKGDFSKAKGMLAKLMLLGLHSASFYNQFANTCRKLNQLDEAEYYYHLALKEQPNYIDAMYNLANILLEQNKTTEAIACFMAILEVNCEHIQTHLSLAKLLLQQDMPEDANRHFLAIIKLRPNDSELLQQIISLLLAKDGYQHGKYYCEKLQQLEPKLASNHYNLGVIAGRGGDYDKAMSHYQQALIIEPNYFAALNNLAVIYLEKRYLDAAIYYFKRALTLQPDNQAIKYTLTNIQGKSHYSSAPEDYITNLFNHYADHYDQHLQQKLNYRVPKLLVNMLRKIKPKPDLWRILDLGCGTGLCGESLALWAKEMIGVDLAKKMIDLAKKKQIYDQLIISDITDYLQKSVQEIKKATNKPFDLVVAGEVFIYFGDLDTVFQLVNQCLSFDGYFIFSLELANHINNKGTYHLQLSGRFCHKKDYIHKLANTHQFNLITFKQKATRNQGDQQIDGAIVLLKKERQ